ncbi:dual oxidase maturation factor 1-like [Penaeus chinensis]|uniref:dual oxidase maturation factor 1-like n=1 Tax=Penaeus chinensis TaxID=139456 RepID=UPI001FB599CA|nr:dual oxidase maturation factor 1-like [Penaeus chinensis]
MDGRSNSSSAPHERSWWWFSVGREGGGPTYYGSVGPCPSIVWNADVILCVCFFSIPLVTFFLLLPSFRQKHWMSFLAMVLCMLSGFFITCTFYSSSWLVGEVEVEASNGPAQPPSKGSLGLWTGLWHANLTYESSSLSLNEQVTWSKRQDMVVAHRMALEKGWVWPLVSLVSELSGEGRAWRGELGDGIRYAGTFSGCAMVASMYMWVVCVVLLSIAPELIAQYLMLMGCLLAIASFGYVLLVWIHVPNSITVSGSTMDLHLGWAWWSVCIMGVLLVNVGAALLLYDFMYPKQLYTIFELYAGTPYHRLFQENLKCYKVIDPHDEEFKKVYPPCYWDLRNFNIKPSLVTGNENDVNNNLQELTEKGQICKKTEVERVFTNTETGKLIFRIKRDKPFVMETLDTVSSPTNKDHTPFRRELPLSLRRRITPEPDRLKAADRGPQPLDLFSDCLSPLLKNSVKKEDFLKVPCIPDHPDSRSNYDTSASPPLSRTFTSFQAADLISDTPCLVPKGLEESSTSF